MIVAGFEDLLSSYVFLKINSKLIPKDYNLRNLGNNDLTLQDFPIRFFESWQFWIHTSWKT